MQLQRLIAGLIMLAILTLLDWYVFQAVKVSTQHWSPAARTWAIRLFWGFSALVATYLIGASVINLGQTGRLGRTLYFGGAFVIAIVSFSKLFTVFFLLIDDMVRLANWAYDGLTALTGPAKADPQTDIPRSEFLAKAGVMAAAVPLVTTTWGVISGAHDYQVRRRTVYLPHLPREFDGIRIAQLSDIHSGSFFNKTAVKGGVEMLLREKPDMVFFTGDLVNNVASEVQDYVPIFGKVKAPLGVYSVLGNHDYGDYVAWPDAAAKQQNLRDLMEAHRLMGWNLLMNEHRFLEEKGEKLAIIGIENWGAKGRFPKYGKLAEAHKGTKDEAAVKLLLSHDPSHWDAQVRPQFPDIDLMFAGHTHGMQFGIEIGNFRWSPVQMMYEQWADLYRQQNQYLYVNRGFGYIGYPGRIGILPEITLLELKRGQA